VNPSKYPHHRLDCIVESKDDFLLPSSIFVGGGAGEQPGGPGHHPVGRSAGPRGQLDDPAANRGRASPRPLRFAANLPTAAAAAATGKWMSAANLPTAAAAAATGKWMSAANLPTAAAAATGKWMCQLPTAQRVLEASWMILLPTADE
jgi:hypothetical protein